MRGGDGADGGGEEEEVKMEGRRGRAEAVSVVQWVPGEDSIPKPL